MKRSLRNRMLLVFGTLTLALLVLTAIPENRRQLKTEHFTFLYSNSIEVSAIDSLSKALEASYERISNDLRTKPAPEITVNIYAQRWRYIKATGNWGASGNIEGVSTLHFVTQAWGESDSKKVAIHEFAHAVVLKLLIDRAAQPLDAAAFDRKFATFPVWLWEAISVYEAGQLVDPKSLPFLNGGSYPGIAELNSRSKGGKIYSCGYTLMEYLLDHYGQEKFIELIENYGDITTVLGVSEEDFLQGWYTFLKTKYSL